MFASFLQAGFECSTHRLKDGRRLDLTASTFHDTFVREDYARLRELGIRTVREGLRWHLIQSTPGRIDFSSVIPMIHAAKEAGIETIWDLFHFGWPDHLDIFSAKWLDAFTELAIRFARMWKREVGTLAFVAPVNEISFFAWAGGDKGFLNPFATGRGPELKAQLVRASIAASGALRSELPDVTIVSPEPAIHIVGDPAQPDDVRHAEEYRLSMFEAWDMLLGRAMPELGGHENVFDVIGINYYDRNQWRNFGETIRPDDPEYRPFHEIVKEIYERYQRPLFISETGTEGDCRPDWFAYISEELRAAMRIGIPVLGVCLYPILDHPGWNDDRYCPNGLWGYPAEDGSRPIYEPLAREIEKQQILNQDLTQNELNGRTEYEHERL